MKYTSIFEKIACLGKIINTSIVYPIFLVILLILVAMLFIKKIKNKKVYILMLISYITLFAITIISNFKALSKVFDSISTNLFTNIYFPSIYTYLFVLLVINIITITSLLNKKLEKSYKITNTTCFLIINFILALILDNVAKNNIDLFSKKSLFGNASLLVLLETSINIFIIWLIAITVIYLTNKITEFISLKQVDKNTIESELTTTNTLVVENDSNFVNDYLDGNKNNVPQDLEPNGTIIENIVDELKEKESLEEDLNIETNIFSPINIENNFEEKVDANILLDRLLNNELPLIKDEKSINKVEEVISKKIESNEKDSYTLNDYRIFNKILKDIKKFNNSNVISIDKNLDLILKAKYTEDEYKLFQGMLKNYSN